ncbi:MAG: SHOCT-like domain-containing protein [Anaerolineae bacterium]
MNINLTYPAEGIVHLIIEALARDAVVRGVPDATAIQITSLTPERGEEPQFVLEGRALRVVGGPVTRALLPTGLPLTVREAAGDLRVQGLAGRIDLEIIRGDARLEDLAGQALVNRAEADLRAERVAELRIVAGCQGDVRFMDGGLFSAAVVTGDLRVVNAGRVEVDTVHGDLWAEKVAGAVAVERATGDARLSEVEGPVTLQALAGDLRGQALAGGLAAGRVNGDVLLSGPFTAGNEYTLVAEGDILLSLPADADALLAIRAGGRIRSDLSLIPAADGSPTFSATLGQGACRILLTGRGDVRITQEGAQGKSRPPRRKEPFAELTNLGERIRQQVAASLAAAGINLEMGERTWDWSYGRRGRSPTPPPEPPRPPSPPERPKTPPSATTAEQLTILKMVEEGRITPEEADRLLRALGA